MARDDKKTLYFFIKKTFSETFPKIVVRGVMIYR